MDSPSPSPSSSSSSSSPPSPSSSPPPSPPSSPRSTSSSNESRAKASHKMVLLRCSLALGLTFISILSISYAFGFFALLFATFSIPPPISVPSQCKIVSTSVDLRSSKICELGLLNYKAKRVFYPSERRKFRCRYDYYWASIFKVEYRDQFSGHTLLGLAEAPREALPSDCRPNFSTAWSTKHMLKVNETYDCWYTSGRSKVEIFQDSYFGCQAKDPSLSEMMRRYSILFTKMMQSWLSGQLKPQRMRWEWILGVIGGILTSMISLTMLTICCQLLKSIPKAAAAMVTSLFHQNKIRSQTPLNTIRIQLFILSGESN
ncbi:uncharacterized protein [Spinacia oleracea]|uniref:Uncharacterized protein isoform X2 n=1 Tax=Spinacia oleracea TaxID=3562 RepID=A0A9R0JYV0_SPIOL|nr:uncharacterized protein LOC110791153 isoform X2 [Spinacia oleracea]